MPDFCEAIPRLARCSRRGFFRFGVAGSRALVHILKQKGSGHRDDFERPTFPGRKWRVD